MLDLAEWNVGFWLMVIIDIAAVVVLGLAILYGSRMWRKRSRDPHTVQAADEATWRLYHPPEASDDKSRSVKGR
jgi:hypothetical protein